jgi:hypothetical protein
VLIGGLGYYGRNLGVWVFGCFGVFAFLRFGCFVLFDVLGVFGVLADFVYTILTLGEDVFVFKGNVIRCGHRIECMSSHVIKHEPLVSPQP